MQEIDKNEFKELSKRFLDEVAVQGAVKQ